MSYQKIVVAGGGVLGSQIAFQSAFSGKDVTIWLRSESSIGRTQPKLDQLKKNYLEDIEKMAADPTYVCRGLVGKNGFDKEEAISNTEKAYASIKLELDLKKAVEGADLVIESMAEIAEQKKEFYAKLAPLLDEKTVVVTNSSTLLPSAFAAGTGRPEKFLSLHFANNIWRGNTAEVMCHDKTDPKYFGEVIEFAEEIHMIPLPVKKEKSGYLLNSMLVPFLLSGMDLVASGVSDFESVDKAWKYGTGSPRGPFEIVDTVGLTTALNIVEQYQKVPGLLNPLLKKMMMPYNFKAMKALLKSYIDAGKLGKMSGEGFYKYEK